MTSMAATGTVRLHLPEGLCRKKNGLKVSFGPFGSFDASKANFPRRRLSVTAHQSHQGVDMINGKRVNGIFVKEEEEDPHKAGQRTIAPLSNANVQTYEIGRFVEDRFVYRQTFVIRSYEIGPDETATMETLMNLLQETALNHVKSSGLAGSGFGATREMSLRKLIWVVTRIHIQVEKYSSWGDVVEVDTWVDAAGKNGMRRDWLIRDYKTQRIITRATSTWVIMNRETRRLSKIPEQVRAELKPFYFNRVVIPTTEKLDSKIDKLNDETAQIIQSGLAPRWSDMDANQHVNNVKYIGWILESVPMEVLENYNMTSMTLEYRRECQQSNLLESLTAMKPGSFSGEDPNPSITTPRADLESTHLLRLQNGSGEIVRARSEWQPKRVS
ncbi:palmitoyl-acyl carrier protein thioesterase, chloroplastic-like [Malania oleifera]|uniref:palmitoyl-acyl carrier protein thioesterase, chloroplastic-like n=1 Tax=Malania oleifera TaxID=397392 RepID=UPI0025ADEC5D|nr:palmitoyl-acyl carrier protein thioesterase, chloroplastic-like [Malania oleifera]